MNQTDNITFRVEETSDLPIWAQLRNRMSYLIKSGQLAPGEQLPSVRSLAAEAKISYNTVTKAYRDLELSDLIVSVRGRGMLAQKNIPPRKRGNRRGRRVARKLHQAIPRKRYRLQRNPGTRPEHDRIDGEKAQEAEMEKLSYGSIQQ